ENVKIDEGPKRARKEHHRTLKRQLLSVTQENTRLLHEVAALKKQLMKVQDEVKEANSYNQKREVKVSNQRDASLQKAKLLSVATRQEKEIELLKLEIQSLKTKCGHVSAESSRLPIL
ncbi:hypothetical protein ACHAWF_017791, partial [Thalassiosira exigua]